jgi:DNA (cytosine-5)-methyltransferase 1
MGSESLLDGRSRPRLLDLFCGAGGAAMGYHRAGFDVVGVDINPQPNYPFRLVQAPFSSVGRRSDGCWIADVEPGFRIYLGWFEAIHASPPCQHYSQATAWRGSRDDHPDLIASVRDRLESSGLAPYIIENVEGARAEFRDPVMICGDDVGLPIYRRRYFETNWTFAVPILAHATHERRMPFEHRAEREYADAMGCDWMTAVEARQAIPPAYTELIGKQLIAKLAVAA